MNTNQVFTSLKLFSSVAFVLILFFFLYLRTHETVFLVSFVSFSIAESLIALFLFVPFFQYDEEFLIRADLLKGIKGIEKINWADVISVKTDSFMVVTWIRPKSGNVIPMSPFSTKNYFFVLTAIIEILSKKNKNVRIDKLTLKLAEKGKLPVENPVINFWRNF